MKPFLRSTSTVTATALLSTLFLVTPQARSILYPPPTLNLDSSQPQRLLNDMALFPPSTASTSSSSEPPHPQGELTISDVISLDSSIKIFADIARSVPSVAALFEIKSSNITVLAPTNKAIAELDRKPWEDPPHRRDGGAASGTVLVGKEGDDRAQENLRNFVDAHIVARRPWVEGEQVGRGMKGEGGKVFWKQPDGRRYIYPENVEVEKITQTVVNGEVWVLKGVVNYA